MSKPIYPITLGINARSAQPPPFSELALARELWASVHLGPPPRDDPRPWSPKCDPREEPPFAVSPDFPFHGCTYRIAAWLSGSEPAGATWWPALSVWTKMQLVA